VTAKPINPMTMLAGSGVFCGATVGGTFGGGVTVGGGGGTKTSGGGGGITTGGTSPLLTPVGFRFGGGKNARAAGVELTAIIIPASAMARKRREIFVFIDSPSSVGRAGSNITADQALAQVLGRDNLAESPGMCVLHPNYRQMALAIFVKSGLEGNRVTSQRPGDFGWFWQDRAGCNGAVDCGSANCPVNFDESPQIGPNEGLSGAECRKRTRLIQ
jgi:hypothetical protein